MTVAGSTWGRAGRRFFLIIFFFFGAPSAMADSAGWVTARAFSSLATCSSGALVSSGKVVGSVRWGGSATTVSAMVVVVGLRLEVEVLSRSLSRSGMRLFKLAVWYLVGLWFCRWPWWLYEVLIFRVYREPGQGVLIKAAE